MRFFRSLPGMPSLLMALTLGLFALGPKANALITGGEGNQPIGDPGWPTGAAEMVNHKTRIAWWEGPPFGGGQYTSEHRGTADEFNEILARFATLEVKRRRLIVVDGPGTSLWLGIGRRSNPETAQRHDPAMDWSFVVWVPERWEIVSQFPSRLRSPDIDPKLGGPSSDIVLHVGGNIEWKDVKVPDGIELVDNRLEAHGFTRADGVVVEGTLTDIGSGQPVAGKVELQEVKPRETGGYEYPVVATIDTDAQGQWVAKNLPQTWLRVVAAAEGYVPRVVTHLRVEDKPGWQRTKCELAGAATLDGKVVGSTGNGIADVEVKVASVTAGNDLAYDMADDYSTTTDADGAFKFAGLPQGTVDLMVHRDGYIHVGLIKPIAVPAKEIKIPLARSGRLEVVVLFAEGAEIPEQYLVEVEPKGGNKVGTYGGSGQIDEKNEFVMANIPPGIYKVHGHPNPTSDSERTEIQEIEVKPGETASVTIMAK